MLEDPPKALASNHGFLEGSWVIAGDGRRLAEWVDDPSRRQRRNGWEVMRDGKLNMDRLERERVTRDDLQEAARMEGIADLSDVRFAVLETDGRFSFVTRSSDS